MFHRRAQALWRNPQSQMPGNRGEHIAAVERRANLGRPILWLGQPANRDRATARESFEAGPAAVIRHEYELLVPLDAEKSAFCADARIDDDNVDRASRKEG